MIHDPCRHASPFSQAKGDDCFDKLTKAKLAQAESVKSGKEFDTLVKKPDATKDAAGLIDWEKSRVQHIGLHQGTADDAEVVWRACCCKKERTGIGGASGHPERWGVEGQTSCPTSSKRPNQNMPK